MQADDPPGAQLGNTGSLQPEWSPDNETHFKTYWSKLTELGEDHKAAQLVLDLNWLIITYFESVDNL